MLLIMKPSVGDYVEVYDPRDGTVVYKMFGILMSKRFKYEFDSIRTPNDDLRYNVYEVLCNGTINEFDEPYWAIRLVEER